MLRLGTVTLDAGYEPPRPSISPRRRAQVLRPRVGDQAPYVEDWGLGTHRLVRLASSANQGFVTHDQLIGLMELYEAGATFELETDLLKAHGGPPDTYTARFDPESEAPVFAPATPGGDLYVFDIMLMIQ
jgi:hypothetical protein